MKGYTHLTIGALTYVNFIAITDYNFDILDIPIVLAFSVLPDIDTEHSKISSTLRKLPMKVILTTLFLIIISSFSYLYFIKKSISIKYILMIPLMVLFLKLFSKNKILKKISLSLAFIFIYYIACQYSILGSSKTIFLFLALLPFFKHRSLSHSFLGFILIAVILYPIYKIPVTRQYYIVACISYISHLILGDIFTKSGVALIYPLSKKKFSLNVFKSKNIYNNLDIPFIVIYSIVTIFTLTFYKV